MCRELRIEPSKRHRFLMSQLASGVASIPPLSSNSWFEQYYSQSMASGDEYSERNQYYLTPTLRFNSSSEGQYSLETTGNFDEDIADTTVFIDASTTRLESTNLSRVIEMSRELDGNQEYHTDSYDDEMLECDQSNYGNDEDGRGLEDLNEFPEPNVLHRTAQHGRSFPYQRVERNFTYGDSATRGQGQLEVLGLMDEEYESARSEALFQEIRSRVFEGTNDADAE